MSKYSNVAHYQDFNELLSILNKTGNSYNIALGCLHCGGAGLGQRQHLCVPAP